MRLSIIVIFHRMRREAPRTLRSLTVPYQAGVEAAEYEIIAVETGPEQHLDAAEVTGIGPNIRYRFHRTDAVSPVEAMNAAAATARGAALAFIVDGARMATPGLVRCTLQAMDLSDTVMTAALSWHLGPDVQHLSSLAGYDQAAEDRLLEQIGWPADGYRLFEISTLAPSSRPGFLAGIPPECSWICLPRNVFEVMGGYDVRFQSPGGGLVNFDFRDRAATYPGIVPVALLGEGVFHQFHGGVSTAATGARRPSVAFKDEYARLLGHPYRRTELPARAYLGTMSAAAHRFVAPAPGA